MNAQHDPNAPYICLGCHSVYRICPDHDAENCPACGAKICPARLWHRAQLSCENKSEDGCGAEIAERASSDVLCTCGLAYRLHPYCANSQTPSSLLASRFNALARFAAEYYLHVLCDGHHVKL